jgi:hypothetical protein
MDATEAAAGLGKPTPSRLSRRVPAYAPPGVA